MSSISSENSNMLNNLRLEEQTDDKRIKSWMMLKTVDFPFLTTIQGDDFPITDALQRIIG